MSSTPDDPAPDVRVRRAATAGEFHRARQLIEEYYAWAVPAAGYDDDLADLVPSAAEEIERLDDHYSSGPNARLLLAGFGDTEPVGVCAIERRADGSAELKRLYVAPSARGRGVASELIAAAVAVARDMGCQTLRLDTHRGIMQPAIALYRRFGFVESEQRCTDIDDAGMVAFELSVPPRHAPPIADVRSRPRVRPGLVLWSLAAFAMLMGLVLPARHSAAAALRPAAAPPLGAAFPPGIWKGVAVVTGGMSDAGIDVFVVTPPVVNFQVEVAPDGTVVGGEWTSTGEIAAAAVDAQGSLAFTGSGTLAGTGARVEVTGSFGVNGTVEVQGQSIPVNVEIPAMGGFSPTSSSCAIVTGDIATEARDVQAATGFATTVTGPFTAHRVGNAGDDLAPGFRDEYFGLVVEMQRLAATAVPPAAEVVALAERVEAFYINVFKHAQTACAGGSDQVMPGTFKYTYFVREFGNLLLRALEDAPAYSTGDLYKLGLAADRIGAMGSVAAVPELAQQLKERLHGAFAARLEAADAAGDTAECVTIGIAAESFGWTGLKGLAELCAAGG